MLRNLNFNIKIGLGFSILIFMLFINVLFNFLIQSHLKKYIYSSEQIQSIIKEIYDLRSGEKDFIIEHDRHYIDKSFEKILNIKNKIEILKLNIPDKKHQNKLSEISSSFTNYEQLLHSYIRIEDQRYALSAQSFSAAENLLRFTSDSKYKSKKIITETEKNLILTLILYSKQYENISNPNNFYKEKDIEQIAAKIIQFAENIKQNSNDINIKLEAFDIIDRTKEYVEYYKKYLELKNIHHKNQNDLITLSSNIELSLSDIYEKFQNSILNKSTSFIEASGFLLVVSILFSLISNFFLSRSISGPLNHLIKVTEQISKGDYSRTIFSNGRDEISRLACSFNKMTDNLKESEAKLLEYNRNLENIVEKRTFELRNAKLELEEAYKNLNDEKEILKTMSITDYLTDIFNRRYIVQKLEEEIQRNVRHKKGICILILDIDYFKRVNDTYGHLFGDEVLINVSKTIKQSIREIDILGRYGGEEFLLILPYTKLEEARIVAERIRNNVKSIIFSVKDLNITISGGLSEFSQSENSALLLQRADEFLYEAKYQGRDRIVS